MSAFYGLIQGNRGASTKGGSKRSGITATAQSWDGSVITRLGYNDKEELILTVELAQGSASSGEIAFSGTLKEFKKALKK